MFLEYLDLKHSIKYVKNVANMSPSGKGPLLKCGRFSVGEFLPIVDFCNLKGYHLFNESRNVSIESQIKSYIFLIQKSFSNIMVILFSLDNTESLTELKLFQSIELFPMEKYI